MYIFSTHTHTRTHKHTHMLLKKSLKYDKTGAKRKSFKGLKSLFYTFVHTVIRGKASTNTGIHIHLPRHGATTNNET